jgi:diadenosine tetraphosphatase ApaH/serine/threonine PP2A family protein phosphatase
VIASADALCVHGSPRSDEERLHPDTPIEELEAALAGVASRVVLHGHTHVQYWNALGGRLVGNPGSVGFPFDGEQRAAWALVDGNDLNLRRTRYDVSQTIEALERSDSPVRATAIARLTAAR